jgi:hypothetical protein
MWKKTAVYVRKCYPEMLLQLCQSIDELKVGYDYEQSAIIVTGTPGVGKSIFLGYVWYHLVKIQCDVVIFLNQAEIIRSQPRHASCSVSMEKFNSLVKQKDIIFLADPSRDVTMPRTRGVTIFFISPGHTSKRNYPSTSFIELCMPPWDYHELRDCRDKIYPDITNKRLDFRFTKWGGSIRCLLKTKYEDKRNDYLLKEFLGTSDIIQIVNQLEGSKVLTTKVVTYRWLVHRFPVVNDDGLTEYRNPNVTSQFPTNYVALKVAEVIRNLKVDWKTVGDSRLLGCAFEAYVLEHFLNVSQESLKVKKIGKKQSQTLVDVPAVKKHEIFSTQCKFPTYDDGTLYIPIEPNRPGIDFVMPPWVFQVTISKTHSAKKLEVTLNQFPSVRKWNICFIIPTAIVNEFKPPSISNYPLVATKYKFSVDFMSH